MKHILLLKLFLVAGMVVSFIACGNKREDRTTLRNVILTYPENLSGSNHTTYPGLVEEGSSVKASFMADGKIGKTHVKEGDRVRKGQLLATLDDTDYKIGVSQLEAQYSQMTKEKERMDAMFEKHNIAPNDYEKFTTGYEQLGLQLEMAKRQLDYTKLYSPSDGYVATKNFNDGELTGAGRPVFTIINDTQMVANLDLPVSVYLDKGSIVSYSGRVPGLEGELPLSFISFTPDAENNMLYHLKLGIPEKWSRELTPGMNISVTITTDDNGSEGSLIPSRAIFDDNGKTFVWVYSPQDSTISKKEVNISGVSRGKMHVVEGLELNDQIVETGVKQLYDGEKVNVLNREDIGL